MNFLRLGDGSYQAREAWEFHPAFDSRMSQQYTARLAGRHGDDVILEKSINRRSQKESRAADLHTAQCVKKRYEKDKQLPHLGFAEKWRARPTTGRPALGQASTFMSCGLKKRAIWRAGKVVAIYVVAPRIVTTKRNTKVAKKEATKPEHLNPKRFFFIQNRREMFCVPEEMTFAA